MRTDWTVPVVLWICWLGIAMPAGAADVDLRADMTQEEFAAAGLEKLTAAELTRLESWLNGADGGSSGERPLPAAGSDEPGSGEDAGLIRSRVVSEFTGWSGDTVFELANGQVWRQRTRGRYFRHMEEPEVEISKNFVGLYTMELVETGQQVGVERVK